MSFLVKSRAKGSAVGGRNLEVRWGKTKSMIGGVYVFLSVPAGGLGVGKIALERRKKLVVVERDLL